MKTTLSNATFTNFTFMNIKEILSYKLVNLGNLTISAYSLIVIIILFLLTLFFLKIIKRFFHKRVKEGKIDKGTSFSIYSILRYFIWIVFILFALENFGVNLNLMLAGSAALLVGLGFGIQQIFNDLVSGIILLFEGNLKVGEIIQLENDIVGKVTMIGLRTSKIRTRDDITMIIPNSKFISDKVINWSQDQSTTRFQVEVGVAYGSDVELVTRLLLESAKENQAVETKPEPFVRFSDFGESSLNFQLLFWTNESFRCENVKSKLRYTIDRKFRENNVQIPFPQRDVHLFHPNLKV
ncbi:MAG: mechanosensitive ion channel [Lentimicrobiaceae bacterium]|nr:mechanosensitive ion channel [Lentimicrobiaceae bacterium]MCB9024336.1 mechanosensitive ion channel [Lentimicrobiaceae bacterium]MCO5264699.1 mechanosensitive ion channel [Lentimicrobium sp.]HPG32540.1 mechanosensitive ion channel [Lentimicrobium sp.]